MQAWSEVSSALCQPVTNSGSSNFPTHPYFLVLIWVNLPCSAQNAGVHFSSEIRLTDGLVPGWVADWIL